jgi:hypothetical protein
MGCSTKSRMQNYLTANKVAMLQNRNQSHYQTPKVKMMRSFKSHKRLNPWTLFFTKCKDRFEKPRSIFNKRRPLRKGSRDDAEGAHTLNMSTVRSLYTLALEDHYLSFSAFGLCVSATVLGQPSYHCVSVSQINRILVKLPSACQPS